MPEETVATTQSAEPLYPDERFKEMVEAGVLYGRRKTKTHPRMKPYVAVNRNGIEIIDLVKTLEHLDRALAFIKETVASAKTFLVVATQPAAEEAATAFAREFSVPAITQRWPGGLLTNFKVIRPRIEYFKKLKADLASGALDKYTKKERVMIEREIGRLADLFGGVETMAEIPRVLLVMDPNIHSTAMREARRLHIPVVAIADVDSDPEGIEYLVVGNCRARASISWFFGKVSEAVREARRAVPVAAPPTGAEMQPTDAEEIIKSNI